MDDATDATPEPEASAPKAPAAPERRPTGRQGGAEPSASRAVLVGLGVIASIGLAVLLGLLLVGGFGDDQGDDRAAGAQPTAAPSELPQPTEQPAPTATPTPAAPAGMANCDWVPVTENPAAKEFGHPAAQVPATGTVTMRLNTNAGVVEITMDRAKAPCTVASFAHLAGKKYFDGTNCHRLVTDGIFVLQCGDPTGNGGGGPTYRFADENLPVGVATPYARGVVAMANSGPDTNGSQFFINFKDSPLDPNYAVIGTVTAGMNVIDAIAAAGNDGANGPGDGNPKKPVTFTSVTVN